MNRDKIGHRRAIYNNMQRYVDVRSISVSQSCLCSFYAIPILYYINCLNSNYKFGMCKSILRYKCKDFIIMLFADVAVWELNNCLLNL